MMATSVALASVRDVAPCAPVFAAAAPGRPPALCQQLAASAAPRQLGGALGPPRRSLATSLPADGGLTPSGRAGSLGRPDADVPRIEGLSVVDAEPTPSKAPRDNAFDLLRLLAAVAVVVAHVPLVQGGREPLLMPGLTLGRAAVLVFFAISGYLVAQSVERTRSVPRFLVHRALRIVPALQVSLSLTAFVLGPLLTTWALADYLAASTPWRSQLRLLGLLHRDELPGVFATNPVAWQTNAPLWTIKFELAFYGLLALLAVATRGRRLRVTAAAIACLAAVSLRFAQQLAGRPHAVVLHGLFGVQPSESVARLVFDAASFLAPFALGAAFAFARVQLVRARWLVLAAAIALPAPLLTRWAIPLTPLAICVLTLWSALVIPRQIAHLPRGWDLSYGVYVYHFPLLQALVVVGAAAWPPVALLAAGLALVLPLAALSWRLVEAPALRWKRRLGPLEPAGT